jgi:hypothetical protein
MGKHNLGRLWIPVRDYRAPRRNIGHHHDLRLLP